MSDIATPAAAPTAAPSAATSIPAVKGAPSAQPTQVKADAPTQMFEVQVDGKPVKMSLKEMQDYASLGRASNKRFEEAATMRKDAESKLARMKTPKDAMKFLTDPKNGFSKEEVRSEFEAWYNDEFIVPEGMTAEQRENAETKKENARLKAEAAERDAKDKEAEESKLDEVSRGEVQKQIMELLNEVGLPKTKFTANRIAYWMRVNESKGINAPKALVVQQVKREAQDIMKSLVANAEGDGLVEILGEETVKKLRAFDLARIRAKRGLTPPSGTQNSVTQPEAREKISVAEVKRRAREFR